MVRPASRTTGLTDHPRLEFFRADLRVARNLSEAFDGIDALVHLAAAVTGSEDAQFAATVVGTEKLLAAMERSTCTRIVLASSISVYDWSQIKRSRFDEESPLEAEADLYDRDGYAVAKLWQERVVRRLSEEHNWRLTVLRPGFIWGADNHDLSGIGQHAGRFQLVIGPARIVPMTHVDNCADCFVHATENPAAVSQTFNIIDPDSPSAWRYAGEFQRRSSRRATRIPIPYFLAMNTARLARRISKWIFRGKGKLPSILVPCRFEARFKPIRLPRGSDRLNQILAWHPALDFKECLRRTYPGTTP